MQDFRPFDLGKILNRSKTSSMSKVSWPCGDFGLEGVSLQQNKPKMRTKAPPSSITLDESLSNSFIIHEEKTKEITTVKEVWICDPNYHLIRRIFALIFSKNYQSFEKLYQTLERVFHQISNYFEVG